MRAGRLVSLLVILQQRGRVTAAALARELEVSERTILRDIEELSGAGIPVFAVRGPTGGFELLDGGRAVPALPVPQRAERTGAARRVRVRITPEGRRLAAVLGVLQPLRVGRGGPDADGMLTATFRLRSFEETVSHLLSLGAQVEVLQPPALRDAVVDRLRSALHRYDGAVPAQSGR